MALERITRREFLRLSGMAAGAAALAVGGVWLTGLLRGWKWIAAPGLFLLSGAAAAGFWLASPSTAATALLLAGALLTLLAWDLTDFSFRLSLAGSSDRPWLERLHLRRLGLVAAVGALLLLLTSALEVRLSFEWTALLALIGACGIGYLASRIQQGG